MTCGFIDDKLNSRKRFIDDKPREEASIMLEHIHDKYPIGQKLQDLRNNRAVLDMLMNKKQADPKQVKPKKTLKRKTVAVLTSCFFVALYFVFMMLATNLVRRDREDTFKRNVNDVIRYISANFDESRADRLNDIYDIGATKDGYQYISAEVYNSNGKLVGSTGRYLCLDVEDKTYYVVDMGNGLIPLPVTIKRERTDITNCCPACEESGRYPFMACEDYKLKAAVCCGVDYNKAKLGGFTANTCDNASELPIRVKPEME